MKNYLKLVGIIAIIAVISFVVSACDNGNEGDDNGNGGNGGTTQNNDPKKITITGYDYSFTGSGSLQIYNNASIPTALVSTNISNTNDPITFSLKSASSLNNDWTGTGEYCICIEMRLNGEGSEYFYYTNGKTWTELGITSYPISANFNKLPKYTISQTVSTIAFNQFKKWP